MAKDTVRYPDPVVAAIDEQVADGVFESKSEFYRFAAEYVLDLLAEEYEPQTFAFDELRRELAVDERRDADGDGPDPFLRAAAAVRQAALRGDTDAAAAVIDDRYEPTDREALLLDELLAAYGARAEHGPRSPARVDASAEGSPARPEGTTDGGQPTDEERAESPAGSR
jgi:Arc/MetJ-type ribon-helix-helix transcriptional regulator